ncbi:ATPase [Bacillus pinisoli]|uniref:ATPase n=1 Tax=Bacillus pinisoli TaxID=2901866 RepID=UPI001FF694F8|nr:ATPase [Bacillus pinisoli]
MTIVESLILPIGIPILVCVILHLFLSKRYKDVDKVDKGFVFNYHRLSYRRKFLRTLTISPVSIIALVIIYLYSGWNLLVYVTFLALTLIVMCMQLLYNYRKWKNKEERNEIDF